MNDTPSAPPPAPAPRSALAPRDTRRDRVLSRAYTRLVQRLRRALPLLALGILALIVVVPILRAPDFRKTITQAVPNLVVENLAFTGLDSQDQPWSLTAARAFQVPGATQVVDLENPQGDIALKDGAWLSGRAGHGRYDQKARRLVFGGGVEAFHDQGYRFWTDTAQVDLKASLAWGEAPVRAQGPFGTLEGQGFRVLDAGRTVVILGPARAVLDLRPAAPSDRVGGP